MQRKDSRLYAIKNLYDRRQGSNLNLRMQEKFINENLKQFKARQLDSHGRLIRWHVTHENDEDLTIGCC